MALCYGSVARSILVYKNRSAQGSAQSLFLYAKLPGSLGWQSLPFLFFRSLLPKNPKTKTKISLAFATKIRARSKLFSFPPPNEKRASGSSHARRCPSFSTRRRALFSPHRRVSQPLAKLANTKAACCFAGSSSSRNKSGFEKGTYSFFCVVSFVFFGRRNKKGREKRKGKEEKKELVV